ncbi:TPA: hypothetical protein QIF87_003086 [Enterobacter ludwigii]|nr:hypothetical protein [Enterobacter ludwigii]
MTKYQRQKPLTTLAMTIQDRIITAEEARAECACFCLHCRCPLLLYCRVPHLPAYFRHDPRSLTAEHVELCAEADLPEIQENPCTPVMWWFCLLCHRQHFGNRRCAICDSGLHCIMASEIFAEASSDASSAGFNW